MESLWHTQICLILLGLEDEEVNIFLMLCIGVILECVLSSDDTRLIVIPKVKPKVIIELGCEVLLVGKLILKVKEHQLYIIDMYSLGIEVEVSLKLLYCSQRRRLIEPSIGRSLIEAIACLIMCFLSHGSLGIAGIIVLEIA